MQGVEPPQLQSDTRAHLKWSATLVPIAGLPMRTVGR
jgi:hypothetical protein